MRGPVSKCTMSKFTEFSENQKNITVIKHMKHTCQRRLYVLKLIVIFNVKNTLEFNHLA